MSLCRSINRLNFYFTTLNSLQLKHCNVFINRSSAYSGCSTTSLINSTNSFHTSCVKHDLMEFFDDKENWGQQEVRVGRSWRLEELRIKSNSDLHKLWYVLLKERNMLLTMQHEYNAQDEPFPNPERIDKVEESMENLETIVRERNQAYFELETGENGERPKGEDVNCFGLTYTYRMREHAVEKRFNGKFLEFEKLYKKTDDHQYISNFLSRLKEKRKNMNMARKRLRYKEVCGLLERFPNVDEEALKEEFPDIDIEEAKRDKASRGHRENTY